MSYTKALCLILFAVSVLSAHAQDSTDEATLRFILAEQAKQQIAQNFSYSIEAEGSRRWGEEPVRVSAVITRRPNSTLIVKEHLVGITSDANDIIKYEPRAQRTLMTDKFVVSWPDATKPVVNVYLAADWPDGFDSVMREFLNPNPSELAFRTNERSTLSELMETKSQYGSTWSVETTKDGAGNPVLFTVIWKMDKESGPSVKYFVDPAQGFCVTGSEMRDNGPDNYNTVITKELINIDGVWFVSKYTEHTTIAGETWSRLTFSFTNFTQTEAGEEVSLAQLGLPAKVIARRTGPPANGREYPHRQTAELVLQGTKLLGFDEKANVVFEQSLEEGL